MKYDINGIINKRDSYVESLSEWTLKVNTMLSLLDFKEKVVYALKAMDVDIQLIQKEKASLMTYNAFGTLKINPSTLKTTLHIILHEAKYVPFAKAFDEENIVYKHADSNPFRFIKEFIFPIRDIEHLLSILSKYIDVYLENKED